MNEIGMKPSEALRKGAIGMQRCKGDYIKRNKAGKVYACCGVGAILRGLGVPDDSLSHQHLPPYMDFPTARDVLDLPVPNPLTPYTGRVSDDIMEANDKQDWTFERQAQWLEEQGL